MSLIHFGEWVVQVMTFTEIYLRYQIATATYHDF